MSAPQATARPRPARWGIRFAGLALALGCAFGLAACAPEPGEEPAPSASATSTPSSPVEETESPEPTPEPTKAPLAAPVTIPACGALITAQQATELGEPRYVELDADTTAQLARVVREGALGPAANAALDAATELRACSWGVPGSDSLTHLFVAVLEPGVQQELRAALDASDFTKGTEGEATSYGLSVDSPIQRTTQWYLFAGDVWVAEVGRPEHRFAGAALTALEAANTAAPAGG